MKRRMSPEQAEREGRARDREDASARAEAAAAFDVLADAMMLTASERAVRRTAVERMTRAMLAAATRHVHVGGLEDVATRVILGVLEDARRGQLETAVTQ